MFNSWFIWTVISNTARLSTALQILVFLPLTLATLSRQAFLLLSLLLSVHSLIHGTLAFLWGSKALSVLQVPMHPFLLLLSFNLFSSTVNPWILTAANWWGKSLTFSGPLFIVMEGLSSLLVAQKLGQEGKKLISVPGREEFYQFALLLGTSVAYVASAWWIVNSYPTAASSPLSSTLLGVALTAFVFLTVIGFFMRRTNIIESSCLALFIAYNVWLCGFDSKSFSDPASSYAPLLPNLVPHLQTLLNFVINTLPKPVLIALLYRLTILHSASRILPTIGRGQWESDDDGDDEWDSRPTSTLTRLLLTYRQFIFVTVYSHLLLLDHSSQIWWRWINIFFTLLIWSIELVVGSDDDDGEKWKMD
ncbi:hypothetical protein FA15DRAFT_965 [Coprinopsis marcescibilis]|uniref:ICE2-domain-containing protein n=1 Tax=Coprinopsis marcescibilis TaxID=230819 RepID=A0A5C3LNL7_COPMA|nr:hypothetical protein FA15DRAFT_965 [Coprinopsis marcescibilis]